MPWLTEEYTNLIDSFVVISRKGLGGPCWKHYNVIDTATFPLFVKIVWFRYLYQKYVTWEDDWNNRQYTYNLYICRLVKENGKLDKSNQTGLMAFI